MAIIPQSDTPLPFPVPLLEAIQLRAPSCIHTTPCVESRKQWDALGTLPIGSASHGVVDHLAGTAVRILQIHRPNIARPSAEDDHNPELAEILVGTNEQLTICLIVNS